MTRYAGGPAESPGFLLWHTTLRWQRTLAAALAPLELTHVQFVLLACTHWLGEQGQRPHQVAIARQAGTDIKMTSQVLRRLEASGLVERQVVPSDSRARHVTVTARGKQLARRAIEVVEAADEEFFASCAPALREALLQEGSGLPHARD